MSFANKSSRAELPEELVTRVFTVKSHQSDPGTLLCIKDRVSAHLSQALGHGRLAA